MPRHASLYEEDVVYEALAWLGYREYLYRTGRLSSELDVSEATDTSLFEPDDVDLPPAEEPEEGGE